MGWVGLGIGVTVSGDGYGGCGGGEGSRWTWWALGVMLHERLKAPSGTIAKFVLTVEMESWEYDRRGGGGVNLLDLGKNVMN